MLKTTRCTHCSAEFTDQELENVTSCPKCGTTGIPCLIADDVLLKINWPELRILGIWADNYAKAAHIEDSSAKVIAAILARCEKQFPDKTPLTLGGEIRKIQEEHPEISLMRGGKIEVSSKRVN